MIDLYTISEKYNPARVSEKQKSLVVNSGSPYLYKVYRLFTGNIQLTDSLTKKTFTIKDNILSNVYTQRGPFYSRITKYISEEISSVELAKAISDRKSSNRNFNLYLELYCELASMHVAYQNDDYFNSFIHIYRVLERIAYAFPMIYARKTCDFSRTYSLLKSFLESKDKGELGFFRKAIKVIFKDDDILNFTFDIDLTTYAELNLQDKFYDVYTKKLFPGDTILDPTTNKTRIVINFINVGDAIITTRNKIVHSLSDGDKLLCSDFIDLNIFFKSAIRPYFAWLSVLFLEIVRDNYNDFE